MSYTGQRDLPILIIVPMKNCDIYQGNDGRTWTEIYIPPEQIQNYPSSWASILVRQEQVCYTKLSGYNAITDLNDDARIKNILRHPAWTRDIIEILTPKQILARYLKWYAVTQQMRHHVSIQEQHSMAYCQHYRNSHQDLLYYISRRLL